MNHRILPFLLASCSFATAAGLVAQAPSTAARDIDDTQIAAAIEMKLWADEAVNANDVDVAVNRGIVTLSGSVHNLLAADRAVEIAESTVGVRAVLRHIDVYSTRTGSDEDLEKSIEMALLDDPVADSYEVEVEADDGVVTLRGNVDSWQEREMASAVTRSVFGVREVNNEIDVGLVTMRSDEEIHADVVSRLKFDASLDSEHIVVTVDDGEVRLEGAVGSVADQRRAMSNAWVNGVKLVRADDLEIRWWAGDAMRRDPAAVELSDTQIREAVRDAFFYDPRVRSYEPEVLVTDGRVVLRGIVSDLEARVAASEVARNVLGVHSVRNHLKVRPTEIPADDVLEERVQQALRRDPFVRDRAIVVDASKGWVSLRGPTSSEFEATRARHVTETVRGVTGVTAELTFPSTWIWRPDDEIKNRIEDHLLWTPAVDEKYVQVKVEDGIATLEGSVGSWSARAAASREARQAGARDVRNRLIVRNTMRG